MDCLDELPSFIAEKAKAELSSQLEARQVPMPRDHMLDFALMWQKNTESVSLSVMSHSWRLHRWFVAHQASLSMEFWNGQLLPSPGDLPNPGIKPGSPVLQADSLLSEPPGKPDMVKESESEVAQLYPTLCDPMDCNPPGSSVHEIFQARVLEWVAISFSRGSSQPRDQTRVSCTAGRRFTV